MSSPGTGFCCLPAAGTDVKSRYWLLVLMSNPGTDYWYWCLVQVLGCCRSCQSPWALSSLPAFQATLLLVIHKWRSKVCWLNWSPSSHLVSLPLSTFWTLFLLLLKTLLLDWVPYFTPGAFSLDPLVAQGFSLPWSLFTTNLFSIHHNCFLNKVYQVNS